MGSELNICVDVYIFYFDFIVKRKNIVLGIINKAIRIIIEEHAFAVMVNIHILIRKTKKHVYAFLSHHNSSQDLSCKNSI